MQWSAAIRRTIGATWGKHCAKCGACCVRAVSQRLSMWWRQGLPLLDTHLQAIELLRDTSHVRDYSVAQWLQMVGDAGLQVQRHQCQRLHLNYASWVERMRTPQVMREAIRALQDAAVDAVRDHFQIDADGSFSTDVLVLWAVR